MLENGNFRRKIVPTLLALCSSAVFSAAVALEPLEPLEPLSPLPSAESGIAINEFTNLWFVELSGNPGADGGSKTALATEHKNFRANARKAGLKFQERHEYSTLFNGFSVEISADQLGSLKRLSGVKAIWPVETVAMPDPEENAHPDLSTAITMTGADIVQSEMGYTGTGIKVAIMDTGIDVDHADFGGDGVNRFNSELFPSERIAYGYDFVGDSFNADSAAATYNPVPSPDSNPDDCGGHGTHVAGIVGANGTVVGVAPDVTFGAYRVFGCEGSTTADIMIAAMEMALADGMDILNMSIGSSFQWPQYPTAQAATRMVNQGMVVVASIGNSGTSGLYAAGAPGLGAKVIGVASYDNTTASAPAFAVSPDGTLVGYNPSTGSPLPPLSGSTPIVNADPCPALPAGSLTGKIALIQRGGGCTFHAKALAAMNAGAAGAVLYNNIAGGLSATVAGTPAITIPVVAITQSDGTMIAGRITAGATDITWTNETVTSPVATSGLISSFSSWGLSPDLEIKPDLGAPGGFIWSTYPLAKGAYASLNGTSMASPHVAGAVALLLDAKPNTNSQVVRAILQNSADPKLWSGNPGLGFLEMVHRQGAGMLDIDDSILATTRIEPSRIATGESEAGPFSETLVIENNGDASVTYDLSHAPALATGPNTFTISAFNAPSTVVFSAASVTVPAGGTASVDVTITVNAALADLSLYGGYLVFTPQEGGQVYRVPYGGIKGDYQAKQVLVPTANAFPRMGRTANGTTFSFVAPGASFTMQGLDQPNLLVHQDHHSRRFRVEIFAENGTPWHRAYDDEYRSRNSTSTGFFAYPLDGFTVAGKKVYELPNGSYYATLSVLKANGDSSNPAHWETWTSPLFVIARP
jgi:minor extracellular serine protease Vpr